MGLAKIAGRGLMALRAAAAARAAARETDPARRQRALAHLAALLASGGGAAAKIAQIMAATDPAKRLAVEKALPALEPREVRAALSAAYGEGWTALFPVLAEKGLPASLGEVHFAEHSDGSALALKIRYPGIAEDVEAELALFALAPAAGPVKKWGFDLDGYRRELGEALMAELDYEREATAQENYRRLVPPEAFAVVPAIRRPLCRPGVLAQSREDGISFEQALNLNEEDRQKLGLALLRHFLAMLGRHGLVHADLHPGNMAFRREERGWVPVLYDFGCVLELTPRERLALLRLIISAREREAVTAAACLCALGYDAPKLVDLRDKLPAITTALLEPFLSDEPFDLTVWDPAVRVEEAAGELRWWLRAAAPPRHILLVRAVHGLVSILRSLDSRLRWRDVLEEACGGEFAAARALALPDIEGASFSALARTLRVRIERENAEPLDLSFPARSAGDLCGLMGAELCEAARQEGVDLAAAERRARAEGFPSGRLFEMRRAGRRYEVWLE